MKFPRFNLIAALVALLLLTTKASAIVPWTISINTNNVAVVTNATYGAVGDGVTTNTTAIQNAINAAALGGATNGLTGGTVEIPPGIYLSGPLTLKSSVNLQIDSGAFLRMLPFDQYPKTWVTNGAVYWFSNVSDFISGNNLTNIEISGSGMIQGQGEPWWPWANTNNNIADRPKMIALSGCNRTLVQNVTLSNSPMFHIAFGGSANTTVQGVTIRANSSSDPLNPGHNTDACDVSGTNILVQNCNVSVGDDNYTCGGGTSDVLISNNVYGNGHGVSIGSYTSPGVANLMVINCSFTGTDQGIRIKSDRDRGGLVRNISYLNLAMTNVMRPILIYTEYTATNSAYRALDNISPVVAASYPSTTVTGTTPIYRDILISNVNATAQSGRAAGLIWGLPEMSMSNITLVKVQLTGSKTFGIYDAKNVRIIDCTNSVPNGTSQFSFFNSEVTFSNSTPAANVVTLDGVTTNGVANGFSFYNFLATLKNTNAMNLATSVKLGAATFTISNNLALSPSNTLSFVLGTNAATMVIKGGLTLGGTNNISAGGGFTNATYTLMTYTGALSGSLPSLGSVPSGHLYAFDITTAGLVKLVVSSNSLAAPPAPTNLLATATNQLVTLTWSPSATATSYNIKRATNSGGAYATIASIGATNYSDSSVASGTTYYYVVSAINGGGEGTNSVEVSATPTAPEIFNDTFSFSTLNGTPSAPGPSGTSYELISAKSWNPTPSIGAGHLKFGIAATGSGSIEVQALFASTPIKLATIGDTLLFTVTFTNTSGLLMQSSAMGFGLYNSGQNYPVSGGMNGNETGASTPNATGNAQTWTGYFAQLAFTGATSQILTRAPQTGVNNNNQDLLTTGGSPSFNTPAGTTVGTGSTAPSLTLVAGNPYTEMLTIKLTANNTLAITNYFYSGVNTNGTLLSQFGGVASGGTFLTNSFDALAIGWRATASTFATTIDINQITINASLAAPVSLVPTNLVAQVIDDQLQLSWPEDHLGWRLQIQTNNLSQGMGTNWVTVPNSTNVISTNIVINPANGSVFLRLVYP